MTTAPQSRSRGRSFRPALPFVIAGLLIAALVATLILRSDLFSRSDPLAEGSTVTVATGPLVLGVSATGAVEPRRSSELAFGGVSGRIAEVLVTEGDQVVAQAPLVILDTRQLQAEVAQAEANLAAAQADLAAVREGATAEQIAEARAQVAAASGSLTQTRGSVSEADLAAARAAVEEARANLAALEAGPENDQLTRARTALTDARAAFDQQRSTLAAAKEQARRTIEQRANEVREAQNAYSSAYWDLEHVKNNGNDPRSGRSLSDAETRDFVIALDNAKLRLADAEAALAQAQVDYETAKQNEITGLAQAEARIASAQADLDELLAGTNSEDLVGARARLARAQADLASLTSQERSGAIAAQQGNLAAAQARLGQLLADPKASDIARTEARVAQAQAQLDQARIRLEDATLRAPFAGTIATVGVAPGEIVGAAPPITLIDTKTFLVKVTVDEVDVTRVAIGQPVEVLIDALGTPALAGTVQRIEPLSQADSSVTSYQVTVEIEPAGRQLKAGMTASATIIADKRDNTLSLPVAAVRTENGRSVVTLIERTGDEVQLVEREVTTGLRTGDQIEITGGIEAGQEVFILA